MRLRTHIVVGTVWGFWVGGPLGGALGAFAGAVPDVDLDVGSVGRGARALGALAIASGVLGGYLLRSPWMAGAGLGAGFLLWALVRLPHRGPTHSLAMAGLWSLLGALLLRDPGLAGAWRGAISPTCCWTPSRLRASPGSGRSPASACAWHAGPPDRCGITGSCGSAGWPGSGFWAGVC